MITALPSAGPQHSGNLFLDALTSGSYDRLSPKLERITAVTGAPIATFGKPTEHVIFPVASVVSAVTTMQDGAAVEVMLVGREGFYGLQVALGENTSPNDAMVQLPNSFWRIASEDFATCLGQDPPLLKRVLRYVAATLDSVSQLSACNRLHPINERCARWLLMAHDRVAGDEILLTQEYLATMLGVRRPSVSIAASALDQAGFIKYSRGRILMRDRKGLEGAACECYWAVNASLERMLAYSVAKTAPPDRTHSIPPPEREIA
ncbi:MAG: Crp/Fnr family transcriptional regulator [Candidatus Eremiobacteraeota bacterium]|nr:Crp/Fnr family transcriptional regulator [Candidatus Eremiobacteraeota bacterium]